MNGKLWVSFLVISVLLVASTCMLSNKFGTGYQSLESVSR